MTREEFQERLMRLQLEEAELSRQAAEHRAAREKAARETAELYLEQARQENPSVRRAN